MSKISRINADVVVNTATMDAGIAKAKAKLNTFADDVARNRERAAKLTQLGTGLLGGAAGIGILSAPFRGVDAYLRTLSQMAKEANEAVTKFKETGQSFTSQGFTPAGAVALAAQRERIDKAAIGGFQKAFAAEAGTSGIEYAEKFKQGAQFLGGFLGNRFRRFWNGDISVGDMFTPSRIREETEAAVAAGMAASSASDTEANYFTAVQAKTDAAAREMLELWRKQLGTGAPR